MEVVKPFDEYSIAYTGGGGGTGTGALLFFSTNAAGAQAQFLPANIIVNFIVGFSPEIKVAVAMSIVGSGDDNLLLGPVNFAVNENKSFTPGVYLAAATEIRTLNTTPGAGNFKFIIGYTVLTGY